MVSHLVVHRGSRTVRSHRASPRCRTVSNPLLPRPRTTTPANITVRQREACPLATRDVRQAAAAQAGGNCKPETAESAASRIRRALPMPRPPIKAIGRAWEEPTHLLVQLDDLKKHEITQGWATEASATIHELGPAIAIGEAGTAEILQHLEQLAGKTPSMLTKINDETLAQNLSRTSYSLERRITAWKQIGRMGGMSAADSPVRSIRELQQVPQRHRSAHRQFVGRACLAEILVDRILARLGGHAATATSGCRKIWPSRCSSG